MQRCFFVEALDEHFQALQSLKDKDDAESRRMEAGKRGCWGNFGWVFGGLGGFSVYDLVCRRL